jgi:hypothetical protein
VDKFPLFLSRALGAGPPVVSFATSTGRSEAIGLRHLLAAQYRDLFARLDSFRVVYVAADQSMFPKAESIFSRLCGGAAEDRTACPSIRKSGDCWIMFHDRDLLERRQAASFDKRQLDQLSDELRESEGRSTRFCSAMAAAGRGAVLNAMGLGGRLSGSFTT